MKCPQLQEMMDEVMELQMAPLIDCVFLLLVFFMVSSTFVKKEADISFALPGTAEQSDSVDIPDEQIIALINKHFDMRPAAIIRDLDLRKPQYRQVAAYGHFGRHDLDVAWERTDKAALLRQEAGL